MTNQTTGVEGVGLGSISFLAELRDFVSKLVSRFEMKRYTLSLLKTKKEKTSLI